jgi:hypothetical protein
MNSKEEKDHPSEMQEGNSRKWEFVMRGSIEICIWLRFDYEGVWNQAGTPPIHVHGSMPAPAANPPTCRAEVRGSTFKS